MSTSTRTVIAAIAAVIVIAGVVVVVLLVTGSSETSKRGSCAAGTYELEVGEDDGAQQVSFDLQAQNSGDRFTIRIAQGNDTLLNGQRTADDEAEVSAEAVATEDGSDRFTVTATPESGQACTATIDR